MGGIGSTYYRQRDGWLYFMAVVLSIQVMSKDAILAYLPLCVSVASVFFTTTSMYHKPLLHVYVIHMQMHHLV